MSDVPASRFPAPSSGQGRRIRLWPAAVLALVAIAGAIAYGAFGRAVIEPVSLAVLFVLAGIGVLSLVALALGLIGRPAEGSDDIGRAGLDAHPDGVAMTDAAGAVSYANAAYRQLLGLESDGHVPPPERILGSEAAAAEAMFRLANAARSGHGGTEEIRLASAPGGGSRWFRVRARPLDGGGALWDIADISRERSRQETLFLDLQEAVDFLDHAPAGFFSVEPSGDVGYINATLADWLGYDLAVVDREGMTLDRLCAGDGGALLRRTASQPGEGHVEILDLDFLRRDGRSMPVRLFHRVPVSTEGVPGSSRTLVLNRTEGAAGEEALRAAEVRFTRFFNNTPIAIAACDESGQIVKTNAPFARMFEGLDNAAGGTLCALVDENSREALGTALASAASGKADEPSVEVALKGGADRHGRVFLSPVTDGGGGEEAVIAYIIDTSDQKALERQFTQTQKMQAFGQLAGGVAHDFNNLLQAIMGNANLLALNHPEGDPSFTYINQITQISHRAAVLVRQILAFSRKQTLRPTVLALNDVVSDLSMTLNRLVGESVKLDFVHGRDLWPVLADLNQFEQVIINLVVNARDAMPGGGVVTIRTRNITAEDARALDYEGFTPADYVACEVSDTGTGIAPEIREKIFEPFFTTKEVGSGTGLGLSTVYGIVKQTGGFIYLDSEIGKGTTFRILLKRHIPQEGEEPELSAGETPSIQSDLTGSATILLVEDEDSVRAINSMQLRTSGYEVHEAATGLEALELLEEIGDEISVVLSDVVMPEMDGPSLLREARKARPSLRFIFVSGHAEDAFERNLPDDEDFAFLPKPFTMAQLLEALKKVLSDAA
ncbi:MAG: PAS domain-containing protein [Hyphomicrobiaceae bacterium]|nr:PAS domain-containing protein [Hyphomicrobiaceae bacterium]